MKHYVHINDACTIETRYSQLSNDVLIIKIGSQETKISSIEFAFAWRRRPIPQNDLSKYTS